ncbi:hypothetical protein [Sphingomonas sp.]|uniref:hypothetical protein n=1 Tax=Sphingomonas sp. TaxID=28214 RepID=UPI001EBC8D72|nr:hypothetical protein [Sphingomonas sp.]MBX3594618.1 hypothetical protein [Sphingomonas sp.]
MRWQINLAMLILPSALLAGAVMARPGDVPTGATAPKSAAPGLEVRRFGAIGVAEGLKAWDSIHAVLSHPRCQSCHVDERGVPLWSGAYFGGTRAHAMNVRGGKSRTGEETLPCATCHRVSNRPNRIPHAPPHAGIEWKLAPVEFTWVGRTSAQICRQLRDPRRNGGRDGAGLIEHIVHDHDVNGFIRWGFDPGPGREKPPGSLQSHLDDTGRWVAAGMPCPDERGAAPAG